MIIAQNVAAGQDPTALGTFAPRSRWVLLQRILSQPKGLLGLTLVILYLLLAIFGGLLRRRTPFARTSHKPFNPPRPLTGSEPINWAATS